MKVTNAEIGWLAGIMDGEGSIGVKCSHRESGTFSPVVSICNTNQRLIDKIRLIFEKLGIKCNIQNKKVYSDNHSLAVNIYVCDRTSVIKLCQSIEQYCTSKKTQLNLVIDYLNEIGLKWKRKKTKEEIE